MPSPSPRAPVVWLLLPLLGGYLAASFLPGLSPKVLALAGAVLAAAAWAVSRRDGAGAEAAWAGLLFAAVASLAAARHADVMSPPADRDGLPPREALLELRVIRVFQGNPDSPSTGGIARVRDTEPHLRDLRGTRVSFSLWDPEKSLPIARGSHFTAKGVLTPVAERAAEDDFHAFLQRSGTHHTFNRLSVKADSVRTPFFFQFCENQRLRLTEIFQTGTAAGDPRTAVFTAMMLGQRGGLDPGQRLSFQQTGTLHLFAISGLHIGVIALTLHTVFLLLRFPPAANAATGLVLLFLFVQITGATPSATRAFLMVAFFWGARLFKRQPNPVSALVNSAFFVLLLFPEQLWSPGFQLSYSVVAGILFLGLPLGNRLQNRWHPYALLPEVMLTRWQKTHRDTVRAVILTGCVSLSATLLSSPLTIHYFNIFSPGAVLLNMLLVPMAGLVIVAGCASAVAGLLHFPFLPEVFNHAAWALIGVMVWLVQSAPAVPGLFWEAAHRLPAAGLPAAGLLVLWLLICAWRRWRGPWFHFATPFLLLALVVLVFVRLTFLDHPA